MEAEIENIFTDLVLHQVKSSCSRNVTPFLLQLYFLHPLTFKLPSNVSFLISLSTGSILTINFLTMYFLASEHQCIFNIGVNSRRPLHGGFCSLAHSLVPTACQALDLEELRDK